MKTPKIKQTHHNHPPSHLIHIYMLPIRVQTQGPGMEEGICMTKNAVASATAVLKANVRAGGNCWPVSDCVPQYVYVCTAGDHEDCYCFYIQYVAVMCSLCMYYTCWAQGYWASSATCWWMAAAVQCSVSACEVLYWCDTFPIFTIKTSSENTLWDT